MNHWLAALRARIAQRRSVVRVSVASIKGSAPREPGARMLVEQDSFEGSVGGGHLELKAIEIARDMLARPASGPARLDRFALGTTLGQCCGGAVNLWFDRFDVDDLCFVDSALEARTDSPTVIATSLSDHGRSQRAVITTKSMLNAKFMLEWGEAAGRSIERLLQAPRSGLSARLLPATVHHPPLLLERADSRHQHLRLFGAGHVGRAIVNVFADLPFDIVWIDERPEAFPETTPFNVVKRCTSSPLEAVANAPRGAWHLVMTHSHDLDYALCAAILRKNDHGWAGLIGSETKATCFNVRFARDGIPAHAIARLTSPIGWQGIKSKLPGAIAVSVAAQLLQVLEARATSAAAAPARPILMEEHTQS
jgi:xanthine dehydrogenase accessory factor